MMEERVDYPDCGTCRDLEGRQWGTIKQQILNRKEAIKDFYTQISDQESYAVARADIGDPQDMYLRNIIAYKQSIQKLREDIVKLQAELLDEELLEDVVVLVGQSQARLRQYFSTRLEYDEERFYYGPVTHGERRVLLELYRGNSGNSAYKLPEHFPDDTWLSDQCTEYGVVKWEPPNTPNRFDRR